MPLGTIPKLSLLEPQNPSCLKLNSVRLLSAFPAFASFKEGSITIDGSAVHFTGRSPNQRTLIPWDAVSYVGIFDKLIGHPLAKRVSILAGATIGSILAGLPLPLFFLPTRSSYNPRSTVQGSGDLFIRSANHRTVLRFSTHRGPIDILVRHTLATRFVFELRDFLAPFNLDHLITTSLPTSYEAAPKQSVGEPMPEPTPILESEIAPSRASEPYIANPIDAVVCSAHYRSEFCLICHATSENSVGATGCPVAVTFLPGCPEPSSRFTGGFDRGRGCPPPRAFFVSVPLTATSCNNTRLP